MTTDTITFIGSVAQDEAARPFSPLKHQQREIKNPREVTELIDIATFRQKLWNLFVERVKRSEKNLMDDEEIPAEEKEKLKLKFFAASLPPSAPESFTLRHLQHIDGGHHFCRALPGIQPTIYNDISEVSRGDENVYMEAGDMPPLMIASNGISILPILAGHDKEICVASFVYWDGKNFRAYTPQNGNPWNHETNMCYRCRQYDTSVTRANDDREIKEAYGVTVAEMSKLTRRELYDWQAMREEFEQAMTIIDKEDDKRINTYIDSLTAMEFTVEELADYDTRTYATPEVKVFAALTAAGYGARRVVARYEKSNNIVVNEVRIHCDRSEIWTIGKVIYEAGAEMAPLRYSMKDNAGIFMAGPERRVVD